MTADKLPEKAAESIIQVSALKKNGDRVGVKMLHGQFVVEMLERTICAGNCKIDEYGNRSVIELEQVYAAWFVFLYFL